MHPEAMIEEVGEECVFSMLYPDTMKTYMAVTLSEVSCYVNFRSQNKDCTDPIAEWDLLDEEFKSGFEVSCRHGGACAPGVGHFLPFLLRRFVLYFS